MRIAVLGVAGRRMPEYLESLARGIESMGHRVDLIDALSGDGYKLPGYEYVVVCAEAISFWGGKISPALAKALAEGSGLSGKKSAAFVKKTSPFFINKTLTNLMKVMEKEGMLVNWSDILLNASQAEALGKRIGS